MAVGTKTKFNKELVDLREEVALLRSFIISILGEDREGRYRPGFVKTILKTTREKPQFEFKSPESLLAQLRI